MKLFEEREAKLGRAINAKKQRRVSYSKDMKLWRRAVRRKLKRDFNAGKEILKRRFGYEF